MTLIRTIVFLVLLTSCGRTIQKDELIGKYKWNDSRNDTMIVRGDGTYEYVLFQPGRKVPFSGTWKLNSRLNEVEFEKENFPFLSSHLQGGSWFSRVRFKDNEIHLMYEPDPKTYLRKVK
jgi:hypothetical protein